jgi:hypothetical protein
MVVARYGNMVFLVYLISKFHLGKTDSISWKVNFIDFFEGTDEMFIATYKPKYPQHQFQIYKHIKKSMSKEIRDEIRETIKDPKVRDRIRDYNLSKLL